MENKLPHAGVFVRLSVSAAHGIGVTALRDIPSGVSPFPPDRNQVRLVRAEEVERIEDAGLKALYHDFCPLVDGRYLAPANFGLLTPAWYMNHSPTPNVDANFLTCRPIAAGEELTIDYRTLGSEADRRMRGWHARSKME
ncbi:MAG TPA: SET domain-containing protein [Chthoniobacterales bacterium]|nr:SET domain-containing protein [Chthoniobacterales bacterium]